MESHWSKVYALVVVETILKNTFFVHNSSVISHLALYSVHWLSLHKCANADMKLHLPLQMMRTLLTQNGL